MIEDNRNNPHYTHLFWLKGEYTAAPPENCVHACGLVPEEVYIWQQTKLIGWKNEAIASSERNPFENLTIKKEAKLHYGKNK